jgi:hypothetical protein
LRVETQKIAHFAAWKKSNPPPFTLPALTMVPRHGTRRYVYAVFTSPHPLPASLHPVRLGAPVKEGQSHAPAKTDDERGSP